MPFSLSSAENVTSSDPFSIVQLSDLHFDNTQISLARFDKVLATLCHCQKPIDLIVVTGDLVNMIDDNYYDIIFERLDRTSIPYVCIAGNHDVTQELDSHLPFEQRRHVPMTAHPKLVDKYVITTSHWQLLFCNSTVSGKIYGNFNDDLLAWLSHELEHADKPCILFCHHHVLPIHSAWLDEHITKNYHQLWQLLSQFPQKIAAIFTGHVHQEHNQVYQGVAVYTVPSLSGQFLPLSDAFAIDPEAKIGYRWITLYNNGQLVTEVKRLDTSSP